MERGLRPPVVPGTGPGRVMTHQLMCPECRDGKHDNCDGSGWDRETDEFIRCPCAQRGHTP
jgi:hypothetical protein